MKSIKLIPKKAVLEKKKNVCAYARVSSGKDAMLHSLSAQISYYNGMIQGHPDWLFVGVYSDEAISGTKESRPGFQRMMDDARAGKIDLIITKSISRFARNTIVLLEKIRELKDLNVDVFFEEQNIHSLSSDGELMLTILASYAQEEARSTSENMKWRIKKNFENGIPWGAMLYGYDAINSKYHINEKEAEVVRLAFQLYLSGLGKEGVARKLNSLGYRTRNGSLWCDTSVRQMLSNYDYTGNLILQKTYRPDYMSKKTKVNNGEVTKYHVEGSHEAIIDLETWNKVQEEIKRRNAKIKRKMNPIESPLKGKIKCGCCGKNFLRKENQYRTIWACATYQKEGASACPTKRIDEEILLKIIKDLNVEISNIERITINNDFSLYILNKDGTKLEGKWFIHSRRDSWTPEMRRKAQEKELERMNKNAKGNSNTIKD